MDGTLSPNDQMTFLPPSNNDRTDQQWFPDPYSQASGPWTSFGYRIPSPTTTTTDLYPQPSFDPVQYTTCGYDTSCVDTGKDANTTIGDKMTLSPAITSHLGSTYGDMNSLGSPKASEISYGLEIDINGTIDISMPDSVSTSSTISQSTTFISQDFQSQHKDKRVKRSASTNTTNTTVSSTDEQPVKRERRSPSLISKNAHKQRGTESVEERKNRNSHNVVEKQYRNRLNAQFESLLDTLPAAVRRMSGDDEGATGEPARSKGEKRVSKGEVLDMGRRHIQALEEERENLTIERNKLRDSLNQLREAFAEEKRLEAR